MPPIPSREQTLIEELLEQSVYGPFGGIQSEVSLDLVEQYGFVDCLNMILLHSMATVRSGFETLPPFPDPADEPIVGIADFYDANATRVQVVMTPTRLLKWDSGAQDWVVITGTLSGGPDDLFSWTVVNQQLCFCQGVDPVQLWDGIASSFGPAAPGVITGTTVGSSGGSGYIVGDTGTITTGNGEAEYIVSTVDGGGAVTSFIVVMPGLTYSVGTDIPTVATSGVGTGFLVDITSVENSAPPTKYLFELNTHLILCYTIEATVQKTQRVRWSGAGDPTDFTSADSGVNDILGDLGPITNGCKVFQTGYVTHQWGITQMIPTGQAAVPFQFVPLTTRARGNTVPYALAPSGEEFFVYIGKDNVYLFNGTNSQPIGDMPVQGNRRVGARTRIFADLATINQARCTGYISDNVNGKNYAAYWLVIPTVAVWVYNFDEQNWTRFSFDDEIKMIGRFFREEIIRIEDLIGPISAQSWTFDTLADANPFDAVLLGMVDGAADWVGFTNYSEKPWSLSGVFVMGDPRHSKTIKKFRITFTDNGSVTVNVVVSNQFGQSVSQTFTEGTGSGLDLSMVLGFNINGIRLNWSISGAAGVPFQLVEFAPVFQVGGEQRGGTVDG